jgi:ABC-type sulfate/molybdate transport systems ATPase subunit
MKLVIANLTVVYNPGEIVEKTAISGLTLQAQAGKPIIISGENGSGKTSLLRAIFGEVPTQSGTIHLINTVPEAGIEVTRNWASRNVGFVRQNPLDGLFPDLSVFENVALKSSADRFSVFDPYIRSQAYREIEERTQATCSFYPEVRQRRIATLSVGQVQILSLGMVLAEQRPIILLDEPTAALDAAHRRWLAEILRARLVGAPIISLIVSHDRQFTDVLGFEVYKMPLSPQRPAPVD